MALTQLDSGQAFRTAYDEANQAIRTVPASNTVFQVELDATDGDSVYTYSKVTSDEFTLTPSTPTAAAFITTDATMISSCRVYMKTISTLTQAASIRIDISPSLTDDTWFPLVTTVNSSIVAGTVVADNFVEEPIIAYRLRIWLLTAPGTGTVKVYLMKGASR